MSWCRRKGFPDRLRDRYQRFDGSATLRDHDEVFRMQGLPHQLVRVGISHTTLMGILDTNKRRVKGSSGACQETYSQGGCGASTRCPEIGVSEIRYISSRWFRD